MEIFQSAYNWIKGIKTPTWLKAMLQVVQDILISIAKQIGREYLNQLRTKIIEVSKKDISTEQKFKEVFTYARVSLKLSDIKDSALNLLIESLVNSLKKDNII